MQIIETVGIDVNIKRPTLKDVAELSGASLRTVKKVMNGDNTVKEKTARAVIDAAKKLNYTRNRAASALARKRNFKIAIVYSEISDSYFPEVREGFRNAAVTFGDYGLNLEFCITKEFGTEPQRNILKELLHREDVGGVIIQPFSAIHLNDEINAIVDSGKPVVTFGADAPQSKRLCYVGPDAYKSGRIGGQILANYIGKNGKVFVINQGENHTTTRERSRGFMERVNEHYKQINALEINLPENSDLYYDKILNLLKSEDIAGMFCTNANTFLAGLALRNLDIKDISLVGFDLSKSSISLMREGFIKVIIETKPDTTAFEAVRIIYEYVADKIIPLENNFTPIYIQTSECFYGES